MTGTRTRRHAGASGRRTATAIVALALALSAAGCGSTLPADLTAGGGAGDGAAADAGLDGVAGDDAAAPGDLSPEEAAAQAATARAQAAAGVAGGPGASTTDPRGGRGPGGGGAEARGGHLPAPTGTRGVTANTIHIGLTRYDYSTGVTAVGAATGNEFSGDLDVDAINAAGVAYINSTGGIAGREVKPVYYNYNVQNYFAASAREQENQRACAHWTEDNQVFAFSAIGYGEELMLSCAARTKTPMVAGKFNAYPSAARFGRMAPYWYAPGDFVAERRERAMVRFLTERNFFTPGAKVGLMVENKPGIREGVAKALKPGLQAAGLTPAVEIVYRDPFDSPWPTYAFQMKNAGVTHVVWASTTSSFTPLLMMRAAEDQTWHPKWGLASDLSPAGQVTLQAPRAQLANTKAMGWRPIGDVNDTGHQSDNGRECGQGMKKGGQPETSAPGREVCEMLFFLRNAFRQASQLSPEGLAVGVGRLGESFGSLYTVGGATKFAPGRHDGPSVARYVEFDSGTGLFKYTTGPLPLSD